MSNTIVNEHEIGTCGMVEELEAAFQQSCEGHGVVPEDPTYFRRYVFNLVAMLVQRVQDLERQQML
jgi:hypothetical protein